MKTRRSILSLIFGAAAAPAAVAVAKAMPEAEVVGTIRRLHVSQLSERALAVLPLCESPGRVVFTHTALPHGSWRLLDEPDRWFHGVPIRIVDEVTND